jgi:hypothetical protein
MAYTIKVHTLSPLYACRVKQVVEEALASSRFTADLDRTFQSLSKGSLEGSRKNGLAFRLSRIRLRTPKLYCGQHPGECDGRGRKMRATYLEWDDWVELNTLINLALDALAIDADVWSKPHDVAGIFWIRKGLKARKRYEWEEKTGTYGRAIREWNRGTEDQFA